MSQFVSPECLLTFKSFETKSYKLGASMTIHVKNYKVSKMDTFFFTETSFRDFYNLGLFETLKINRKVK